MKKKEDYVGIDISKEKIDVRLFNEKKGKIVQRDDGYFFEESK